MKKTLLLASTLLIFSCSGITTTLVDSRRESLIIPQLNTVSKKDIGDNLVTNIHAYYYDAINLKREYKVSSGSHSKHLPAGVYANRNNTSEYTLYSNKAMSKGIAISKTGDMKYYTLSSGILNTAILREPLEYEKTTYTDVNMPYFTQEFIYSGKIGTTIKFLYREYTNDLARPAFTQELQYDLNESKIIGCKGLRIEVIKATNLDLEYKVINYFHNASSN